MRPEGALEPESLVELSARRLRQEILTGALAPGERLIEEQLTQRFGISRAPLREALRSLGQQGLVEHLPRRGVRVANLAPTDVDELFGLRDVLERHALEQALPLADAARLAGLAEALTEMTVSAKAGDAFGEYEAHRRFHLEVVRLAGRRHLLAAYEPVILKLQLSMAANLRREAEHRTASESVERHRRLFEAIASDEVGTVLSALAVHGARTYIG